MLEFVIKEQEGIEIVDLKGRLTLGEEDLQFRSELDQLVQAGKIRVVLNLDELNHLDTTGLGTLLYALAKLRKAGGGLALVNLKPLHIEILVEVRLEAVFNVYKEDQDAVNSFFPDRKVPHYDILQFVRANEKQ
jgi:anti-sigma B factor antagonist